MTFPDYSLPGIDPNLTPEQHRAQYLELLRKREASTRKLSAFVSTRIDEHADPDEAEALRELWNMAHDQIDVTPPPWGHRERLPSPPRLQLLLQSNPIVVRQYVPGEVKNAPALRELARRWRDHPDFLAEWETP